jgi:hypothetical protein
MFKPTYHILGTLTNPAAVTKSMGLPSDALLSWFLHCHLPVFIPGVFLGRLPGHRHLDHFIVTANLSPSIGTVQKHMPTLTQTAPNPTTGPLAFMHRSTRVIDYFYLDRYVITKIGTNANSQKQIFCLPASFVIIFYLY